MPHDIMEGMDVVSRSPFHTIARTLVYISPDPSDREVYKVGSQRGKDGWIDLLALSKISIDKLMTAAGIEEISSNAERVGERRWIATYIGQYTRPDGSSVRIPGTKEVDLSIGGARWKEQFTKHLDSLMNEEASKLGISSQGKREDVSIRAQMKLEETDQDRLTELKYIADSKATRAIDAQAKFGLELAETGARLRAVRGIMQIGTYTAKDLEEPFIVYSSRFNWESLQQRLPAETVERLMAAHVARLLEVDPQIIAHIPEKAGEPAEEEEAYGEVTDVDFTVIEPFVEPPDEELIEEVIKAVGGKRKYSNTCRSVFGFPPGSMTREHAEILLQYATILGQAAESEASEESIAKHAAKMKGIISEHLVRGEIPNLEEIPWEEEDGDN